jgi:hypothetical protein
LQSRHGSGGAQVAVKLNEGDTWSRIHHAYLLTTCHTNMNVTTTAAAAAAAHQLLTKGHASFSPLY